MEQVLDTQIRILAAGLLTGGGIGAVLQLYGRLRTWFSRAFQVLTDIGMAMIFGAWTFAVSYSAGCDDRLAYLLFVLLGWLLYRSGLEKTVSGCLDHCGDQLKKLRGNVKKQGK